MLSGPWCGKGSAGSTQSSPDQGRGTSATPNSASRSLSLRPEGFWAPATALWPSEAALGGFRVDLFLFYLCFHVIQCTSAAEQWKPRTWYANELKEFKVQRKLPLGLLSGVPQTSKHSRLVHTWPSPPQVAILINFQSLTTPVLVPVHWQEKQNHISQSFAEESDPCRALSTGTHILWAVVCFYT